MSPSPPPTAAGHVDVQLRDPGRDRDPVIAPAVGAACQALGGLAVQDLRKGRPGVHQIAALDLLSLSLRQALTQTFGMRG